MKKETTTKGKGRPRVYDTERKRVTIIADARQYEAAKLIAAATQTTISDIIGEALAAHIEAYRQAAPANAALLKSQNM